jgi:hypothetical protein
MAGKAIRRNPAHIISVKYQSFLRRWSVDLLSHEGRGAYIAFGKSDHKTKAAAMKSANKYAALYGAEIEVK